MEITNNIIKLVSSLAQKKYRNETHSFVAEGTKCVLDTIDYFNCSWLIASKSWLDTHSVNVPCEKVLKATPAQLKRMSQFSTPSDVIAVYELPTYTLSNDDIENNLTIVLDTIQDPGNLGTIVRIADWYGIRNIVCSLETADAFSHKVIQATMGAISRVHLHYCDLQHFFETYTHVNVFGTFLDGDNIYTANLPNKGIIVFGNEGKGISPKLEQYINHKLLIPSYPPDAATSESLNVSVATAITVSEFRRRALMK